MVDVFKDYEFLAKYHVRDTCPSIPHKIASDIVAKGNYSILLDVGGGINTYLQQFNSSYKTIVVDVAIGSLRKLDCDERIVGALPRIPLESEVADVVSAFQVIEHLPEEIYYESLREISRLSKDIVIISAPFMQDLSGAYTKCPNCANKFQCEGHHRSFGLEDIYEIQKFFGKLCEIYFYGEPLIIPCFFFKLQVKSKAAIRRFIQKVFNKGYASPPFTKCPKCNLEIFNRYDEYCEKRKKQYGFNQKYFGFLKNGKISTTGFTVVFSKKGGANIDTGRITCQREH